MYDTPLILHFSNISKNICQKSKSSQSTSNGTRRSYVMQKTNTEKSHDIVLLLCRYVFGMGGTGTCASSATTWQVYSQTSSSIVTDSTMKVSCAAGTNFNIYCRTVWIFLLMRIFSHSAINKWEMFQHHRKISRSSINGSFFRILRWVLQYINQKLSLRPIITSHNILSLFKGNFAINKKQSCTSLYCDIVSSRLYWKLR